MFCVSETIKNSLKYIFINTRKLHKETLITCKLHLTFMLQIPQSKYEELKQTLFINMKRLNRLFIHMRSLNRFYS